MWKLNSELLNRTNDMEILRQPSAISFTGNPILFSIKTDDATPITVEVDIRRYSNSIYAYPHAIEDFTLTLYPIRITRKGPGGQTVIRFIADFDLSDVLDSYAVSLYEFRSLMPSLSVSTNGEVRYRVSFPDFPEIDIPYKIAIPGGVSNAVFLKFMNQGTNVFSTRFCDPANLFLFSNRSSNKININYYASELCDAWFVRLPGKQYKLVTSTGSEFEIPSIESNTQYFETIDLAAAYAQLAPEDDMIHMSVDDEIAFIIHVYPDPVKEEKHILEFRNSFGFMERMLLFGKMKYEPEITEGEEYVINENGVLRKNKQRGSFTQVYKSNIGYKRMTDILFLQDLLMSEEVRIYNPLSDEFLECSVSAEISLSMVQSIPESIPIEIKVMNPEKYMSLDYDYYNRIFDETFSGQFS